MVSVEIRSMRLVSSNQRGDCVDKLRVLADDDGVRIRLRRSSLGSSMASIQTSPTRSDNGDISVQMSSSVINSDQSLAAAREKIILEVASNRESSERTMIPKQSGGDTGERNKASRTALAGIITKVMAQNALGGRRSTISEADNDDSPRPLDNTKDQEGSQNAPPAMPMRHAGSCYRSDSEDEAHQRQCIIGHESVGLTGSKKLIPRSASAITAAKKEHLRTGGAKRLPQRSSSDLSGSCPSTTDRDLVPRLPPRRGSFQKGLSVLLEEAAPTRTTCTQLSHETNLDSSRRTNRSCSTQSSGTSEVTPPLSGDQLQSFVMSRLPAFVQDRLPEEEWKRVFAAAAAVAESNKAKSTGSSPSTSTGREAGLREHKHDDTTVSDEGDETGDDASTVVSALTISPSLLGDEDATENARGRAAKVTADSSLLTSSCGNGGESKVTRTMARSGRAGAANDTSSIGSGSWHGETSCTESKRMLGQTGIPSRSWHEGSATHERAPRVPSRSQRGTLSRRMSAPLSPTPKLSRAFRRQQTDTTFDRTAIKNVCFSELRVRYYERILDVNPCTSSGPSVGIGWNYKEMKPIDLSVVEDKETDTRALVLSRYEREKMLYQLGYKQVDMARAVRQTLKLKNQRVQTYNNIRHQAIEYAIERSRRKVGKILRLGAGR